MLPQHAASRSLCVAVSKGAQAASCTSSNVIAEVDPSAGALPVVLRKGVGPAADEGVGCAGGRQTCDTKLTQCNTGGCGGKAVKTAQAAPGIHIRPQGWASSSSGLGRSGCPRRGRDEGPAHPVGCRRQSLGCDACSRRVLEGGVHAVVAGGGQQQHRR